MSTQHYYFSTCLSCRKIIGKLTMTNVKQGVSPQRKPTDVVITKSNRVIGLGTEGGVLTSSLHRCMNAVILTLQKYVSERYHTLEAVEEGLGEAVLEISLPFKKFAEYMGWKSTNFQKAKEVISYLEHLRVKWDNLDTELSRADFGFEHFVVGASVRSGIVTLKLSPEVRRELLNAKRNPETKLNLLIANYAWRDKYTARLYEKCVENICDDIFHFQMSLDEIRKVFDVPYKPVKGGKRVYAYPSFSELNRNVISKAVKNLNKTFAVDFTVEQTNMGVPVEFVSFSISRKKRAPKLPSTLSEKKLDFVISKLSEYDLKNVVTRHFKIADVDDLEQYELFYVGFCLELFERQLMSGSIKASLAGYFSKCLSSNVDAFSANWKVIERSLKDEKTELSLFIAKKREEIELEVTKEYRKEVYNKFIATLSDLEKEMFFEDAMKHAKKINPSFRKIDDPEHHRIRGQLMIFLLDKLKPELIRTAELNRRIKQALMDEGIGELMELIS